MKRILLTIFVLAQVAFSQKERPNIILMMADDLGFGDVGFTANNTPGHKTPIKTPHLDQMAAEGLELDNFYSIGPVCSPTRGSFLSGRHYVRFGIFAANEGAFPADEISLARICKDKGYATGHFGKWHIGTLDPNHSPKPHRAYPKYFAPPWERDYDKTFVTESSIQTWNPISSKNPYYEDGKVVNFEDPEIKKTLMGDDSKVMMDRIIPFIEKSVQEKKPFMSVVWFHAPHEPFIAGPEYKAMYSQYTEHEQNYYGCVTALDDQVGRLNKKLKDLGIDDNTIILFCSDNGPEKKKPGQTGGLRERKRSLYNGGVMVPSFVKWPAKIKGGKESNYQTSVLDLLPTVAELIDYKMPDNRPLDGASLLPFINGEIKQRNTPIPFLHNKKMAWIKGDYKFRIEGDGKAVEAYDMVNDRNETKNIISKFDSQYLKTLKNEVIAWNCSASKSYWGMDYPNKEFKPVDPEWKGLSAITCDGVPQNPHSALTTTTSSNEKSKGKGKKGGNKKEYDPSLPSSYKILPNLENKTIRVKVKNIPGKYNLTIEDEKGKIVHSEDGKKNTGKIDTTTLPKGTLTIKVYDAKTKEIKDEKKVELK